MCLKRYLKDEEKFIYLINRTKNIGIIPAFICANQI